MTTSSRIADLRRVFADTPLQAAELASIEVPDSSDLVFACDIAGMDAFAAWTCARERCDVTGLWPVLTIVNRAGRSWADALQSKNFFSRFHYAEEFGDTRNGNTPGDIVAAAQRLDVIEALSRFPDDDSTTLDEELEIGLEGTRSLFGKAPAIDDRRAFLQRESIADAYALERWLFDWEIRNGNDPLRLPSYGLSHLLWNPMPSDQLVLLLFPSLHGWEIPAYISWFGATRCNSQLIVALLHHWHRRYGAELVAHYGTMLQFVVARRPTTAEEALELAWQQYLVAPCTTVLPGVSVRDHARALLHTDRWFLHERP